MPKGVGVSSSQVAALLSAGLTRKQAADALGVTPQTIAYHVDKLGGSLLQEIREYMPWGDIDVKYKRTNPYKLAHWHVEYMITGGEGMSANKLEDLRNWYKMLREYDLVLVHDPSIPGRPGLKTGGFEYVKRQASDNDLIIRANGHTRLTDPMYDIWRLPETEPGA